MSPLSYLIHSLHSFHVMVKLLNPLIALNGLILSQLLQKKTQSIKLKNLQMRGLMLYVSMRISLVMSIWKFIVQGEAADYKVNISQGPRHCLYCPRRSQGQYRQCRGPRDIFFHEHCNQWDTHEYIVFILQMESPVNLCSENAVISFHSYWGSK